MIDWLDFTIEIQHPTISSGAFIVVDEFGELVRQSDTFRKVQGSYDSSIQIRSTTSSSFYSDAMIHLGLRKGFDSSTHSSAISFYGNPAKYLQGHNVIGPNCLRSLALGMINDVFPKIGLSNFIEEARLKVLNYDFWITRIDLTNMYDLGASKSVDDYLYMMPLTVKARGDRCDYTKSTFYVGKHSTLWSLKFYNKKKELLSRSKHHKLNPHFDKTGLLDFAEGMLRVELTLRKKQLDRLRVTHASKLNGKLDELFDEFIGRISMVNQSADPFKLDLLSDRYQATYFKWREGKNPKSFLKGKTFYNHRNALLDVGIDISNPPIPLEERVTNIDPITKTLSPKLVSWDDIPTKLIPYLVKPILQVA